MHPTLRIIDANLNRASEGLRVMEDLARFAIDDRALCSRLKAARHDLRSASGALYAGPLQLRAARDTPGDVGVAVKTPKESRRDGLSAIASAAAGRTTEALRSIEECAKAVDGRAARRIERTRYQVYELDRHLTLALGLGRAVQWRLCVILTESLCRRPWLEVARRAIDGGADCLQLREKSISDRELRRRAALLVRLGARHRVPVIINDRADVACSVGAAGVHLGQDDLSVREVRLLAGDALLAGVSTHSIAEARRALLDGADYVGVGAMFPSATKRRAVSGPPYLRRFLRLAHGRRPLPHLAIGGITPQNVGRLVAAGCRGIAVSSVVCAAERPEQICRQLLAALPRKGGGGKRA